MKAISWLSNLVIPGETFSWYSRLPPDELRAAFIQTMAQPQQITPSLKDTFRTIPPHYAIEVSDTGFTMSVHLRSPTRQLILTGTISPYAEGSLLRGRVTAGNYNQAIAWIFAILGVAVILVNVTKTLLYGWSTFSATVNLLGILLLLYGGPRLEFHITKRWLLHLIQGRFLARDLKLPAGIAVPAVAEN